MATTVDALLAPGEFFAERDVTTRSGLLVVVGAALLTGLTGVAFVAAVRELLPLRLVLLAVGATLLVTLLLGVLGWLAATVLLYVLTVPVADDGSLRALLGPVGLGMLPHVLKGALLLAATVVVLVQLPAPADEAAARELARQVEQGPLVAFAAVAGTARATVTGSMSQFRLVAGVASTLWSGRVWVPALEEVRGVSRRQAVAAVAVVVVLMLLNGGL